MQSTVCSGKKNSEKKEEKIEKGMKSRSHGEMEAKEEMVALTFCCGNP